MGIMKRAHVRGINHTLIRMGLISYPNEKIAEEVADAVADNIPQEAVPEVTPETGLSAEEANGVIQQLAEVAEQIAEKTGGAKDENLQKLSNAYSLEDVAYAHATNLMEKAAAEIPGQGTPSNDMVLDESKNDVKDNPSSAVVVEQGSSALDASAGAVGDEKKQEKQPGAEESAPDPTVADVKLSSLLAKLSGADGVLPVEGGRKDLKTNAGMGKDMIVPVGDTKSTTPAEPVPQVPNPAASDVKKDGMPDTDIQEDVKKVAATLLQTEKGRVIIAQLKEAQATEEAAKVKEAAEHNDAAAVLMQALSNVSEVTQ